MCEKNKNIPMKDEEPDFSAVNTSALAYLGDAVYELYIRKKVFDTGEVKPDILNRLAVQYVRAEAQAIAFDKIFPELTKQEQGVARRGKNHKITSMPHNLDTNIYKKATGFEALVGYLFLSNNRERLESLIKEAVIEIDRANKSGKNSFKRRSNEENVI